MDFSSDHYFDASLERMTQARELYGRDNCYALTMYVSGVAVESMLRAFMLKKKTEFDSRHDLKLLLDESGILGLDPAILEGKGLSAAEVAEYKRRLETAVDNAAPLWHNNYRYASEARLLSHLKRKKLYRKVKGDVLKANALKLLIAARNVIDMGTLLWL
jgi:HEPN domain-containing protein